MIRGRKALAGDTRKRRQPQLPMIAKGRRLRLSHGHTVRTEVGWLTRVGVGGRRGWLGGGLDGY